MRKIAMMAVMAAGVFFAQNDAAAQTKFGYISLNEIVGSMPEAKKADSVLTQYQEALVSMAKDKEKELNERIAKFNTDSSKMSAAVKEVKRGELQKLYQELTQEDQVIQQKLEQKQQELSAPIQKKAMEAVNAVAKENGYTYVFPKEYLVVSPPADDLLPLVKRKLGLK
jgi:outer membrane protein